MTRTWYSSTSLAADNALGDVRPHHALKVVIVACAFEPIIADPDALLDQYHSLVAWADALVEAGVGAVAVVQRFPRSLVLRRKEVDYHFVADGAPPFPPPRFWGRRVAYAARSLRPDVVHVDGLIFPALVWHLRLTLPRRTAILVQDHGGTDARSLVFQSRRRRVSYRFGLRAADGFLFTAREQAVPWQRAGVIGRPGAIYEIPESSTDLSSWPISSDGDARLPGQPALLWVGRLDTNKDPMTVLHGFELAAQSLPQAEMTFVFGEDRLLPQLKSRIEATAVLRDRVHLRGRVERRALPALYARADLFVLGSHHEGSGYALLEALSFGVTPVVTDIPSFRALTDAGKLGALFPPGNAHELANALARIGKLDLAERRALVRAYFDRHLSWPAVGRSALEVYEMASIRRGRRHAT